MKKTAILLFIVSALVITGCKKNDNSKLSYVGSWDYSQIELDIFQNNTYQASNGGIQFTLGKYVVTSSQITFTDTAGYCGFNPGGKYSFILFTSTINGPTQTMMTLTNLTDSCSLRDGSLPGTYTLY